MTKSELKSVIKECLLEILTEGIGKSLNEVSNKKKVAQALVEKREHEKRMLQRKREVGDTISMVTADPVMKKIFSHTAETTLREQSQHDARRPSVQQGGEDFESDSFSTGDPGLDISKIFGGSAKNWATMAFSDKKRPG